MDVQHAAGRPQRAQRERPRSFRRRYEPQVDSVRLALESSDGASVLNPEQAALSLLCLRVDAVCG